MPTIIGIYIKLNIMRRKSLMNNNFNSRGIPKPKEVEPIKKPKDIVKIQQYFKGKENKRDYMLFVVGINVGLRAGDLLELKIKDVLINKDFVDTVLIKEQKTRKGREITLNKSARDSIKYYLSSIKEYDLEDFLFKSQKGSGHLTVEAAHKIIKGTLRDLNVKGNYGTHSLRKTWAYHIYINNAKNNPMILPTLQKMLNHSSQSITLRYIGITKEVILTDPKSALTENQFNAYRKRHKASDIFKYDSDSVNGVMKHMKAEKQKDNSYKVYYLKNVNDVKEEKTANYWMVTNKNGQWLLKNGV